MLPVNHKSVIVLDHTPNFGSNHGPPLGFSLESLLDQRVTYQPAFKTLWACGAEACLEYCRIVWDLFPRDKLIRLIVSDTRGRCLNDWTHADQLFEILCDKLQCLNPPSKEFETDEYSIVHGLKSAVQVLSEPTDAQMVVRRQGNTKTIYNCGRILCISSIDVEAISQLEERMDLEIYEWNRIVASSESLIPINYCEFVFVNLTSAANSFHSRHLSSYLSCQTHTVGIMSLAPKMSTLVIKHYGLSSTTIMSIPMKNESSGVTSWYSVELLHLPNVHQSEYRRMGLVGTLMGYDHETVMLNWRLERNYNLAEKHCKSVHVVTPVNLFSKANICLVNYLSSGKPVTLETIAGSGVITHVLTTMREQLFLHDVCDMRNSLIGDASLTSEGPRGTFSENRMRDFGWLMTGNSLSTQADSLYTHTLGSVAPRLNQSTSEWPLTESEALVFDDDRLKPLVSTVVLQPELSDSDVDKCKQCILSLLAEAQAASRPEINSRSMAILVELQKFLQTYCFSENHRMVLSYLENLIGSMEVPSSSGISEECPDEPLSSQPSPRMEASHSTSPLPSTLTQSKSVLDLWIANRGRVEPRPDFDGIRGPLELTTNGNQRAILYSNNHTEDNEDTERFEKKRNVSE